MDEPKWMYEYKIDYYLEEDYKAGIQHSHGIVIAANYIEAITRITQFYGDDLIESITYLSPVLQGSCFEFEDSFNNNAIDFFKNL